MLIRYARFLASMAMLIVAGILLLICSACSGVREVTKEVPVMVEKVSRDTVIINKWVYTRDSIVIRDSVAPNIVGGLDRWHSEFGYINSENSESERIVARDTVQIPVYLTEYRINEVEKNPPWYKVLGFGFTCVIIGALTAVIALGVTRN